MKFPWLWEGPREDDLQEDQTTLKHPVPPERWPYGPPEFHQEVCWLYKDGLYCDCAASDASDYEWGASHYGTGK